MTTLRQRLQGYRKPIWLEPLQRNAALHWQRLAPRERRLVWLATTMAALAVIWLVLLEPALETTSRLRASLPVLRAQAAQVEIVIAEARELSRQAGTGATFAPSTTALNDSLQRAGLSDSTTLAALDALSWEVTFVQAPLEPILLWLRDLPFELRLRAAEADLSRSPGEAGPPVAGLVSGTVMLTAAELTR